MHRNCILSEVLGVNRQVFRFFKRMSFPSLLEGIKMRSVLVILFPQLINRLLFHFLRKFSFSTMTIISLHSDFICSISFVTIYFLKRIFNRWPDGRFPHSNVSRGSKAIIKRSIPKETWSTMNSWWEPRGPPNLEFFLCTRQAVIGFANSLIFNLFDGDFSSRRFTSLWNEETHSHVGESKSQVPQWRTSFLLSHKSPVQLFAFSIESKVIIVKPLHVNVELVISFKFERSFVVLGTSVDFNNL